MNASVNPRSSVNQLLRIFFFAGCLMFAFALPANATTFTVTKSADTSDGQCNADCSLREAIIASNSNGSGADIINFANIGVITPTSPLPAITGSLTIVGNTLNSYPN